VIYFQPLSAKNYLTL
jgi:hypothetical protein